MRAGKLDRLITIERAVVAIDAFGVAQENWTSLASMRAELIEESAAETTGEGGAVSKAVLTFRTRFVEGVTLADRIIYEGRPHNLKGTKEIGRRRELELTVQRLGQ